MFCTKCGKELPEGALACPDCGEKVKWELNFNNVKAYAGEKAQQASASIQNRYQEKKDSQKVQQASKTVQEQGQQAKKGGKGSGRRIRNVDELFVSLDEKQIAIIGGGYLSNLLNSGTFGNGFGILTNRRLYFRGELL